jgi:Zn-dependent peptidase ImmA (M78 family)
MPSSVLSHLEHERSTIKLSDLRKLAEYFKRPLGAFLLATPPTEPKGPPDFRILPGQRHSFERDTRLAIRKIARLRGVAAELMTSLDHQASPQLASAKLSDSPAQIAQRERASLQASTEIQLAWQTDRQAYRWWRSTVEGKNILVFQVRTPVEDARGFSFSDGSPFAIAVSSADAVRARCFTLFHEYAHLLLRTSGICLPGREPKSKSSEASVERWCDQFAGELLVPPEALHEFVGDAFHRDPNGSIVEVLGGSSRSFKVSEQVILWRMLDLNWITKAMFRREMTRLQKLMKKRTGGGGQFSVSGKVLNENGRLFTSLVLEARGRNLIDYSDVSDYLSVNLKYFAEVRSSLSHAAA